MNIWVICTLRKLVLTLSLVALAGTSASARQKGLSKAAALETRTGACHAFGAYDAQVSHEARRVARTAIKRAVCGDAA